MSSMMGKAGAVAMLFWLIAVGQFLCRFRSEEALVVCGVGVFLVTMGLADEFHDGEGRGSGNVVLAHCCWAVSVSLQIGRGFGCMWCGGLSGDYGFGG